MKQTHFCFRNYRTVHIAGLRTLWNQNPAAGTGLVLWRSSGLLNGRAVVAAGGDRVQDVLQVVDVSQDGVNVQVDAGQLAPLGRLLLLHVQQPRPQIPLHLPLSAGQRVLQLLQTVLVHHTGLIWRRRRGRGRREEEEEEEEKKKKRRREEEEGQKAALTRPVTVTLSSVT